MCKQLSKEGKSWGQETEKCQQTAATAAASDLLHLIDPSSLLLLLLLHLLKGDGKKLERWLGVVSTLDRTHATVRVRECVCERVVICTILWLFARRHYSVDVQIQNGCMHTIGWHCFGLTFVHLTVANGIGILLSFLRISNVNHEREDVTFYYYAPNKIAGRDLSENLLPDNKTLSALVRD